MTFYRKFKDKENDKLVRAQTYLNSVKIVLRTIKEQLSTGD